MKVYRKAHPDSTQRRVKAAERLEAQLSSGTKNYGNHISGGNTPLTDADRTRIHNELKVLKQRIP